MDGFITMTIRWEVLKYYEKDGFTPRVNAFEGRSEDDVDASGTARAG
jgi:hypothetical protein